MRAVLLDALGTLVGLEPPAPRLVLELEARGVTVLPAQARAAMHAEMAYYRAEHHRGGTADGLAALRSECACVLGEALGPEATALGMDALQDALLSSLVFFAYPEVPGVLRELRQAGVTLVVCSNWDLSLLEVLTSTGLDALVDGVVVSAVEGARAGVSAGASVAKPDGQLFTRALEVAGGVDPAAAVHVGDSVKADACGALSAGLRAVLVRRSGDEVRSVDDDGDVPVGTVVMTDLTGLGAHVLYPRPGR